MVVRRELGESRRVEPGRTGFLSHAPPDTLSDVEDNKFGVPAGWYPDPLGLPQLRWWDSQAWTEHTSEARAPIVIQPEPTRLQYADDDLPSRREQRERERARTAYYEDEEPAFEPAGALDTEADEIDVELSAQPLLAMTLRELEPPLESAVDDAAPGPRRASSHANAAPAASTLSALAEELAPEREMKQRGTYTAAAMAIAVLPLLQAVASVLLIVGGLGHNFPLLVIVAVAPYLLTLGFAAYDKLVLQTWGYEHPTSPWWALLGGPVYLVMRGIATWRENGKGFAPLVVFGAALTGVIVAVIALPGIIISLSPVSFTEEIEASVQADAAAFGADLTVECPQPPVMIGETVVCTAESAGGESNPILVGLERQNGWIAWQVKDWGGLIF